MVRGRADEEFTIAPLAVPVVVAPPPYENPPSFEDSIKTTQVAATTSSQSRQEQGETGLRVESAELVRG